MNKICKNPVCKLYNKPQQDADGDLMFCPECGQELSVVSPQATATPTIPSAGLTQDNRIHSGDNIGSVHHGTENHVAGDFASTIDKSSTNNVTTTNNTTNTNNTHNVTNNIFIVGGQAGQGGTKIPGASPEVQQSIDSLLSQSASPSSPQPRRETAAPQRTAQQPSPTAASHSGEAKLRVPPPSHPIAPRSSSSGRKWAIGGLFAAAVVGLFFFLNSGSEAANGEQKTETPTETNAPQTETAQAVENASASRTERNTSSRDYATSAKSSSSPKQNDTPAEKATPSQASPLQEGVSAYNSGNYAAARLHFNEAATAGQAEAAYYLGKIYGQGQGTSVDLRKSFTYMKQAAEGGYAKAYFELAEMYRNGDGTEPNRTLAKKWYEKAVVSDKANSATAAQYLEMYE